MFALFIYAAEGNIVTYTSATLMANNIQLFTSKVWHVKVKLCKTDAIIQHIKNMLLHLENINMGSQITQKQTLQVFTSPSLLFVGAQPPEPTRA